MRWRTSRAAPLLAVALPTRRVLEADIPKLGNGRTHELVEFFGTVARIFEGF